MKLIKNRIDKNGKLIATVELDPGESLHVFRKDAFYRLGGQMNDVVEGSVIVDSDRVTWCSIEQKWIA